MLRELDEQRGANSRLTMTALAEAEATVGLLVAELRQVEEAGGAEAQLKIHRLENEIAELRRRERSQENEIQQLRTALSAAEARADADARRDGGVGGGAGGGIRYAAPTASSASRIRDDPPTPLRGSSSTPSLPAHQHHSSSYSVVSSTSGGGAAYSGGRRLAASGLRTDGGGGGGATSSNREAASRGGASRGGGLGGGGGLAPPSSSTGRASRDSAERERRSSNERIGESGGGGEFFSSAAAGRSELAIAEAFARIDANGDGVLSRTEVIACRANEDIRALLGLPKVIRQEDGTRDAFEAVFQRLADGATRGRSRWRSSSTILPREEAREEVASAAEAAAAAVAVEAARMALPRLQGTRPRPHPPPRHRAHDLARLLVHGGRRQGGAPRRSLVTAARPPKPARGRARRG